MTCRVPFCLTPEHEVRALFGVELCQEHRRIAWEHQHQERAELAAELGMHTTAARALGVTVSGERRAELLALLNAIPGCVQ